LPPLSSAAVDYEIDQRDALKVEPAEVVHPNAALIV
jgi:hypothetical protein